MTKSPQVPDLFTGNSGISRDLCNANTYRSIHEVVLFNSSPALDLKYPLRLPYIHLYLCSLHLHFEINYLQSQIFQPIRLTVSGRGGGGLIYHLHFKISYLHSRIFQPIILTLLC
jgi:hypothetical protein